MQHVSTLPKGLAQRAGLRNAIVFDGECVLCSRFFGFMQRHDREARFSYVLAQSPLGQQLYLALGLPERDFETNLVIVDGQIFQRMDAFAAAMRALGAPYAILSALRWLPRRLKDPAYHFIARNRYRVFGRSATCMVPDATLRSRFLPDGWAVDV